jgi:ectoine hydroxylase-related dioxygenase (phytanoyl-CoA dioxygenase family)
VFQQWTKMGEKPSTHPPKGVDYAPAIPVPVKAGEVLFMHYLLVHASSANHADIIRVGMNTAVWPDPERPYIPKSGPPTDDWTPMDYTLRTDIP